MQKWMGKVGAVHKLPSNSEIEDCSEYCPLSSQNTNHGEQFIDGP